MSAVTRHGPADHLPKGGGVTYRGRYWHDPTLAVLAAVAARLNSHMALVMPTAQSAPTYDAQAETDATDEAAVADIATAVINGCAVTWASAMNLAVAAGNAFTLNTLIVVPSVATLAVGTASATDRRDLVVAQIGARSFTDGVTNGTTTFTSAAGAAFTAADTGRLISGPNIVPGTTMTYVSATQVTLSVAATGSGTNTTYIGVGVVAGTPCSIAAWAAVQGAPLPPVKPACPANSVTLSECYVPGGASALSAGSLIDKTPPVRHLPPPAVQELATNHSYHEQVVNELMHGSFVALTATAKVTVTFGGNVAGPAQGGVSFYHGTIAQPLCAPTSFPNAGATLHWIGSLWEESDGCAARSFVLTGLTPGTTYNWQVMWGNAGLFFDAGPITTQPYQIALRSGVTTTYTSSGVATYSGAAPNITVTVPMASTVGLAVGQILTISGITGASGATPFNPNGIRWITAVVPNTSFSYTVGSAITGTLAGTVTATVAQQDRGFIADYAAPAGGPQIIPFIMGGRGYGNIGLPSISGNFQPYGPELLPGIIGSLTGPAGIKTTPDGTLGVVGCFNNVCHVFDCNALTMLQTYTITGASWLTGLVVDNTYAYFIDPLASKVWKVGIMAGGANAGTPASLALGSAPASISITPDGTKLIIGLSNGTVAIVNTNTGSGTAAAPTAPTLNATATLTGIAGIGGSTSINTSLMQPDGLRAWVTAAGTVTGLTNNAGTWTSNQITLPGTGMPVLPVGSWVTLTGFTPAAYNSQWQVATSSPTSLVLTAAGSSTAVTVTGTATGGSTLVSITLAGTVVTSYGAMPYVAGFSAVDPNGQSMWFNAAAVIGGTPRGLTMQYFTANQTPAATGGTVPASYVGQLVQSADWSATGVTDFGGVAFDQTGAIWMVTSSHGHLTTLPSGMIQCPAATPGLFAAFCTVLVDGGI